MSRQTRFDLVLNARGFAWRPAGRHCVWRRRTLPDLARCSYGWRRRPDLPRAADERSPPPGCETRPCPRKQSAPLNDGRDPNLHSPAYHFAALSTHPPGSRRKTAFSIPISHAQFNLLISTAEKRDVDQSYSVRHVFNCDSHDLHPVSRFAVIHRKYRIIVAAHISRPCDVWRRSSGVDTPRGFPRAYTAVPFFEYAFLQLRAR